MSETGITGTFQGALASGRFCYGAELVTTRGFVSAEQPSKVMELGRQLCDDPRITWVSITDNPGGNVMLPPDWLGQLLAKRSAHLVLHLTCKDRNRNALESAAWRLASDGFENILAMTGDYPRSGFGGQASPVFDLDSVNLIELLKSMNDGLPVPGRKGEITKLPPTHFFIGAVVSPFKRHENELMPQYFKLLRKISCGAQFVIPQLGYDLRKFHEVKLLLASHGIPVPLIGNVYLLNRTVAEMFHKNQVAGCVVSDKLMDLANKYAQGVDKGKSFFLDLAAKQMAAFKGLGFAGGYIGGTAKAETFFEIIERSRQFGENDWKEFVKEIQFAQPGEFYLFEQDSQTGLGDVHRLNAQYVASLQQSRKTENVTLNYRLSRWVHDRIFTPDTTGFHWMKRLYEYLDTHPGPLSRAAHSLEHMSKFVMYGCKDCGDCSLPEIGYLCPMISCSKGARNGPCGGAADGQCEMLDKQCIWARAYDRAKFEGESEEMLGGPAVFYNAQLKGTSAWANTFLGRDHLARKNGRPAPAPPESKKEN